jgi:hypothetical protein
MRMCMKAFDAYQKRPTLVSKETYTSVHEGFWRLENSGNVSIHTHTHSLTPSLTHVTRLRMRMCMKVFHAHEKRPTLVSKETYTSAHEGLWGLQQSEKRPKLKSKETYTSVKRDLP